MYSRSARIQKYSGFTLIELLIVISIVGILAGILAVVLRPDYYLADSRNARRRVDVHTISIAIADYALGKGYYPASVTSTRTEICKDKATGCTGLVNLSMLTDHQRYLTAIPNDPKYSTENSTGYSVYINDFGRVTVVATHAEKGEVIEAIR